MEKNNPLHRTPCPWCGASNTHKRGKRKTHQGAKQMYLCLKCNARFTDGRLISLKRIGKPHPRITYSQNWSAYNYAQTTEKLMLMEILSELSSKVVQRRKRTGRPRTDIKDLIFCCAMKVYTGFSGRRLISELKIAQKGGYIFHVPHYNTIFRGFGTREIIPVLKEMITVCCRPLKFLENSYAADSTGFSTSVYSRWVYERVKPSRNWVKCHAMTGTRTNCITAIEVSEAHKNDSPYFVPLLYKTAENFNVREVSADKAYSSAANLEASISVGAMPYIMFRDNAKGSGGGVWSAIYSYFSENKDKFMEHYHKRSNVESSFSAIKRKFGGSLKSRGFVANKNEVLFKVLCHNICCLIQESNEAGLRPQLLFGEPRLGAEQKLEV